MENTAAYWQNRIFTKSFPEQLRFRQMERLFGNTTGDMRCIVAGGTPAMHQAVQRFRGQWTSAAFSQEEAKTLSSMTENRVLLFENGKFPAEQEEVDRIILVDVLERIDDDAALIAECHRILKNSGILLLVTLHRKKYGLLRPFRRLLDVHPIHASTRRDGYTGAELFDLLKDGFDVQETHTFSHFFTELGTLLTVFLGGFVIRREKNASDTPAAQADYFKAVYRFLSILRPFLWILSRFDLFLFLTRGYLLIACAKKRMWRPRKTPVLRDGRSIAEATLGGKIGSALEY
ncbi:MAG: methyltransferase domain-containing protein [Kiritimatiellae bacterium]|nr:methyltransferase domain-containing protein [Kiritimatiellia bacterium]